MEGTALPSRLGRRTRARAERCSLVVGRTCSLGSVVVLGAAEQSNSRTMEDNAGKGGKEGTARDSWGRKYVAYFRRFAVEGRKRF